MKILFTLWVALYSVPQQSSPSYTYEIVKVKLSDGEILTGRLALPAASESIKQIVIYVHGTGPGTYSIRRKRGGAEYEHFQLYTEEFTKRGIAFFTYNKRGVEVTDKPPTYDSVNREKYKKCLPSVEADDIASVIKHLKSDKRLKKSKVTLFGFSEGSIIAPIVAENKKNGIDALFLGGYANENLAEVIKWQNTGGSSMVNLKKAFDTDGNDSITKQEYMAETKEAAGMRKEMQNARFEDIDFNKDSTLTRDDFKGLLSGRYKATLDAIDRNDDDWIWNYYFKITSAWLKEHFALEPNKTRLLKLDIPIYIFHGEEDANVPVEGVYDIEKTFKDRNKNNLQIFVFKDHGHGLNYQMWQRTKVVSEGVQKIFEVAESLNK